MSRKRNKVTYVEKDSEVDEDFSFEKKKKSKVDSEIDQDESTREGNSDDNSDSYEEGEKRRKKKKMKLCIPGERKSSRSKAGSNDLRELTDKEFEKMLEEEELQKINKKNKKKEQMNNTNNSSSSSISSNKNKIVTKLSKRINPKKGDEDNSHSGNESDHLWYCELCKDGGDLLLCDTCPKSFHKECLKIDGVPDGDWSCPVCKGEALPEKNESSDEDAHDTACRFCKDGGDVILCDFCPLVFHMHCLDPPLTSLPEGDWKCPICVIKMTPLKAKVKQVLTWRWKNKPEMLDELDHTHSPQKQQNKRNVRELFVKFEYHSYWDCEWMPELQLEVFQPITHMNFKRKFDQTEPPALDDGSSFGRPRHKNTSSEDDPHNLEERFYRYGIKPEWLQIHRIIGHDGKGKERRYLVKWRDLPYAECTWESIGELPGALEDFDKYLDIYWTRRKLKTSKDESKKADTPKKSSLRRKLEKQPAYIDDTGGCLHPYQLEGLNWLRFSWSQGTNTILADEMGLGKTVQAISFLYSLYKEGFATTKPFLVSAPLSTVPNWEREFEYWAPELYVVTYTGQKDNRTVIREHEFCYKEGAFSSKTRPCRMKEGLKPKFDVLLTSYEYVHMDYATLSSINWGVLIIDEAHRLKNNQSLFFRTMADYSLQYKLLLTGTPLQNNLEELFNLLHFLEPDKFQNMEEFLNEFSEISKDEQVMKLHELLAPHMLRRMKMDVLKDIPSKSEFIVRIELSSMQKKYYKHILTRNYEALNAKGYSNQTSLINIMMDLRKCCNHPYLFPAAEKDAPLTSQGLYEGSTLAKASGKLEMLEKMLNRLKRDGHRVLLFSQMTRMLDILEDFMTAKNYGYERIDGSIASNKRQECIDRFNSKDSPNFVFLLSTRAGGLGINLATADTVIIYDMDWNPHNDIQAFSRAHRIGQKNKVMIYRFVTRNTVEEKIAQVCKQKMMLSELIVHRGMSGTNSGQSVEKVDSLTRQEISDILKYGAENLFRDDEEGQVVYTDQDIERLLDRSIETEIEKEKEKDFGMNEYLRSFKVASYQVKEGVDDQEEEEEKEDEKEDSQLGNDEKIDGESDVQYWQRILGPAYNEHLIQTLKEQEELANKLGKGKRIRKQINYAEREMMETVDALSKVRDSYNQALLQARKRCYLEEDVTFQSDYEPSSTSDEDATSAKEDDGSENSKKKKNQQKGPPPPLPPLVDRVDGQVLVLGFTARQRRAFLDAVMRYGMPPEDPYRSQWLVRDLRGKTERNFKAYVSLFMRHLCEPISDNSDKFADGVPREGLSRQHVLTRIGVVALIRKKVHEFEYMNGVESMAEFKPKNPLPPTIAPSLSNSSGVINISDTNDTTLSKGTTISTETTTTPILSTKINPTDSTATSSTTFITTSNTATTAASPTSSSNTAAADDKAIIVPDTPANTADVKTESEVPAAEVKDDSKAALSSEVATNQDITTATAVSKESTTTANTLSTANSVANSTVTEVKDEVTTTTTVTSVVSTTITSGITPTSASSCDVTNNNNKEAVSTSNTTAVTTNTTTQTSVTVAVTTTTTTAVSTAAEVQTNGSITKGSTKDLRSRFWIADGGFTELHSLWQLEEQQLVESRAYETWHRLHDFWLLAGVITHGYRHWQDILSDPRFEVLNQAFKSEGERARKAAFLNRRFQLLEQAMVIEEQLRKAISDNLIPFDTSVDINSTLPTQALARLKVLDDIGNTLKNSNNNDKSKSSKMQKVLNQINVLVNDINDMSYINMPASLCKPYPSMLRPQAPTLSNKPPTITSTWNNQHNKNTQYISPMAKSSSYSHNNYSRGEQVSNSGRMVNSNTSNTSNVKQSSATSSSTTSTTNNKDNNTSKDVICID